MRSLSRISLAALALSALAAPSFAQVDPDLVASRTTLYEKRAYRQGFPEDKTRSALRAAYRTNNLFDAFVTLRREFQSYLVDAAGNPTPDAPVPGGVNAETKAEATLRLQECVNEVLSGQLQLGNEQLLNAGRRKFPSVLSLTEVTKVRAPFGERDAWKELALAGLEFESGVLEGLAAIRAVPNSAVRGAAKTLRSRGGSETINTPAEGFANYTVINQSGVASNIAFPANETFVRTEAAMLFNLLNRRGIASGAMVDRLRRLAFRENNEIDGRQRHGEAGERKKEDLNRRAMRVAKRDAQLFFYTGLALRAELPATAGQVSQDDFKLHNGDKAFAAMSQLNILFKDIRDGKLPTGLADQFVPSPNKRVGGQQGYLSDAITSVTRAKESQNIAEQRVKEYQQGAVSRVEFNRSIREQYLTQLGQMTGFLVNRSTGVLTDPLDPNRTFDLKTPESRKGFLAVLNDRLQTTARALDSDDASGGSAVAALGALGSALVQRKQADVGMQLSLERALQIPAQASRIEERVAAANGIVKAGQQQRQAWEYVGLAADVTRAFTDQIASQIFGIAANTKAGTAAVIAALTFTNGLAKIKQSEISTLERIDMQTLDAQAQVKEILAGKRAAELESSLQATNFLSADASLEQMVRQVSDLVENLSEYRSETADLWFLDPSLEVEKVDAELQADLDLQDCLATLYDLTRTLEFYWTEKFQNPVQTVDGGIVTLPNFANDFTELDDLYAINDAYDAEKYLNSLGFSLSGTSAAGWDSTLRALRQSIPATNQIVVLSLRQDVLPFAIAERGVNVIEGTPNYGSEVAIHNNGQIVPGRESLYAYYENESITKFRDELQKTRRSAEDFAYGTGRDYQDFLDGFEFEFSTTKKSRYFFDAREWNMRLESIAFDVRTEGGFLPPGQEENFVRLNVIQEGTVEFRRSFPLELSDPQFDTYQTEFTYHSDRLRMSPYEFPVQASVNGSTGPLGGSARVVPYFFSPVCSNWRVVLDPLGSLANNYADIDRIKDIRITLTLRSGIPPTLAEGL